MMLDDPRAFPRCWRVLVGIVLLVGSVSGEEVSKDMPKGPAAATETWDEEEIEALRPISGIVGRWSGTGTGAKVLDWKETIAGRWGLRPKDGRVALEMHVDGKFLNAGLVSFDKAANQFVLTVREAGGTVRHFRGELVGGQSLRLDRVEEGAKDGFDRAELRLVQEGDKLIYSFSKKRGSKSYEIHTQVELKREGTPLSEFASGPMCVVTGGAGRFEVEWNGKTYHVACERTRQEFLEHPEKYAGKE
ncbi:MAG: hypothetical protein U1D30_17490 [Planctomycetota bacterium]